MIEGEPIGQIIAPIVESINEDGSYKFKDTDGDGDFDFEDWQIVGNGLPDFEMSLNNAFTFGRFDVNIFLRGSFGHDLVHMNRVFYEVNPSGKGLNNIHTKYYNENVKTASYNNTHIEDASFVKWDNVTFAYTFDLGGSRSFKSARVYLTGQNLLTITDYTGYDPEVSAYNGNDAQIGVDLSNYPTAKIITFGIDVTF